MATSQAQIPKVKVTDGDRSDGDDSDASSESSGGWDDVNDSDDKEEAVPCKCLFCDKVFDGGASETLNHCAAEHKFSWPEVVGERGLDLDFYGKIKLINFLRANPNTPYTAISKALFADDKYLQPVVNDDPLLFGFDEFEAGDGGDSSKGKGQAIKASETLSEVEELKAKLEAMESQFVAYRETVRKNFLNLAEGREGSKKVLEKKEEEDERDNDSHYFSSYAGNDIHETMLKDSVRTDAYRDFVYDNKDIFKGKVVLDVGCGTGILSMFCAKAGAKKVYAVDNSAIIDKARANVFENGMDNVITCLRGKIEEVTLPVKQVDIIISEWMGYCLLYEAMLDSVIWARDRYLAADGLMVPSQCKLMVAAMHHSDYINDSVNFWSNIYGFRMSAMQERIREDCMISHLPADAMASEAVPFFDLPLRSIKTQELVFTAPFQLEIKENIESLDAFIIYFDTYFSRGKEGGRDIFFTTGPEGKQTHWRQGVLLVERKSGLMKQGQKLQGNITYKKRKDNTRELDIEIEWETEGVKDKQVWIMR